MSSVGSFLDHRRAFQLLPASLLGRSGRPLGRDFLAFAFFALLGSAAAYISIPIPQTPLYIDPRWAIGVIGVVLIRRIPLALLMVLALSAAGPHRVPLYVALLGNMLYAIPFFMTIRIIHDRYLDRLAHPAIFAVAWFLLVLLGYEVFITPLTFGLGASLDGRSFLAGAVAGWTHQPFLLEAIFVGLVSALALALVREHTSVLHSHTRWMTTFDAIGDAVIITDAQGRIEQMNPVAESLTGWSLDEARDKVLSQLVALEDPHRDDSQQCPIQRALAENRTVTVSSDTVLVTRSGRRVHISDSASPIRRGADQVTGAVLVFRDITSDYQAHEALQRSEERFRTFVENATDVVYALNLEGEFTYVSPNWQEHFGEPALQAIGRSFEHYVLAEDVLICRDFLRELISSGQRRTSIDYRIRRADGDVRWQNSTGSALRDASGNVIGYTGIARDITQRRRDSEMLERHAGFLAKTGQLALVGGWEIDVQRGKSTLSETAKQLCEMDSDWDPSVEDTLNLSPPEDRKRMREVYERAVTRAEAFDIEADLFTGKGNKKRIRLIGTPEFENGQCVRVCGATQDITPIYELEMQLRQAQKMEAIGQLAGGVAHDFNNLLTPILGLADLCLSSYEMEDELRNSLDDIRYAAQQARELTAQLLAFGRRQVLVFKPLELSSFIQKQASMLRRLIREDIDLHLDLAEGLPCILADTTQISQVLINLTINAVDAMPTGGQLDIRTHRADQDPLPREMQKSSAGPWILLEVRDTGCGIPPRQQEHIFEPFFTTKEQEKGTGLGLATVYGIVQQHDGHIQLDSQPDEGTVFRIYLPADVEQRTEEPSEPSARDAPGHSEARTILLVEDDPAVLRFTSRCLEHQGHEVLQAGTAKEALRIAQDHTGPIDLLLTDVIMPDRNGAQLHEHLCRQRPELPVLFMSSYTSDVIDRQDFMDEGVQLLEKPFTAEQLTRKIQDVLQQDAID